MCASTDTLHASADDVLVSDEESYDDEYEQFGNEAAMHKEEIVQVFMRHAWTRKTASSVGRQVASAQSDRKH